MTIERKIADIRNSVFKIANDCGAIKMEQSDGSLYFCKISKSSGMTKAEPTKLLPFDF